MRIFPCEPESVSLLINKLGYECWQQSAHIPTAPHAPVKLLRHWRLTAEIQRANNSLAHFDIGLPPMWVVGLSPQLLLSFHSEAHSNPPVSAFSSYTQQRELSHKKIKHLPLLITEEQDTTLP